MPTSSTSHKSLTGFVPEFNRGVGPLMPYEGGGRKMLRDGRKRSWVTCIRLAFPELRLLIGLVMVATALAYGWLVSQPNFDLRSPNAQAPALLSLFAILAFAPPLVFNFRNTQSHWLALSALLGMGWRNAFSIAALVWLMLSNSGRDFLLSSGLVACYFPLLVLQSWLLTRQANRL